MTDKLYKAWAKRRDEKLTELKKLLSFSSRVRIWLGRAGGLPK